MSKSDKRRKPRSKSKPQSNVPAFLLKTYEIIEDPEYHEIVCWNDEGDAFIVKNVTEFSDKILPKYFKHNNFASFVRQLNMYDFHKIRHESNENEFQHPSFKRGHKELLSEIKRKTPDSQPEENNQLVPVNNDLTMERFQKEAGHFTNELQLMKTRQNDLEKASKMIFAQNSKLLKENKLLWSELMRNKEKYEKKIEKMMLFVFSMMQHSGNNNKAIGSFSKTKSILDDADTLSMESEQSDKEEDTQLSRIDNKKDHEKFYKQLSKYFQSKGNKNNIDRLMEMAKKGYFENTNANTPMLDEQPNFNFDLATSQNNVAPQGYAAQGRLRPKRNPIKPTGGYPDEDLARGLPSKAVKTEAQSYPVTNMLEPVQNPMPMSMPMQMQMPMQTATATLPPQVDINQMNQMNQMNPMNQMYSNPTEPYMESVPLQHTFSFPSLGEIEPLKSREPSIMQMQQQQQPSLNLYQQPSYNNYYGNPQPMNTAPPLSFPMQPSEPQQMNPQMNWLPQEPDALLNFTKPDESQNLPQNPPLDLQNSFNLDGSIGSYSPGPNFLSNNNQEFNFGQAPDDVF